MRALTEVVEAGKARYIGFSEWPPDRIQAALDMRPRRGASSSPVSRSTRRCGAGRRPR